MKVFLVGGATSLRGTSNFNKEIATLKRYVGELGEELAIRGHDLVLCSPFQDSADYYAAIGASQIFNSQNTPKSGIEFHYPQIDPVVKELNMLIKQKSIARVRKMPCVLPVSGSAKDSIQYSWLFAQLKAMDSSAGVIAVGGKLTGSAQLLFSLAMARNKSVLPLTFLGGAASEYYAVNEWELSDILVDQIKFLADPKQIRSTPDLLEKLLIGTPKQDEHRFFISYPHARPNEADYVEAVLRRRNCIVYRDEHDFEPAAKTEEEINKHIKKANVFIAIWCKEYACSPYCFDELVTALKRLQDGKAQLWILCVDDTRMIPKAARDIIYFQVRSRKEIENEVSKLLRMLKKK